MDNQDEVFPCKTVRLVKVLWQHRGVTWECKDTMCANYPLLFKDEGMLFSHLIIKCRYHMHVYVRVNFRDKILLRGGECKTREKLNFF